MSWDRFVKHQVGLDNAPCGVTQARTSGPGFGYGQGSLVGAGGRRPRLEGADSRPIFMPKNYQIKIHGTGPRTPCCSSDDAAGSPSATTPIGSETSGCACGCLRSAERSHNPLLLNCCLS